MARKYELNKRALKQEETRLRIVDATVALHEEVGPAQTSISAIAKRAGVERLTVYRHFPDERDIFLACSARYRESHPLPDVTTWLETSDPLVRLQTALRDVYRYYESAEQMLSNVFRDAPLVPTLRDAVEHTRDRFESMVDVLLAGWDDVDQVTRRNLAAAIRLALDFNTWRVLARSQGFSPDEAAIMLAEMVWNLAGRTAIAEFRTRPPRRETPDPGRPTPFTLIPPAPRSKGGGKP